MDPLAAAVAAGRHVRIDGPRGPIHVWIPASYRAETGATVVYVHGYFNSVDEAWTEHRLGEQFALSAANALFVVPEAPQKRGVPVNYPSFGELLRLVEDGAGVSRGMAHTAAFGHSGAIRTLYEWLDEPLIDTFGFIDAMYMDEQPIVEWLGVSPRRRLLSVGEDTIVGHETVADLVPDTLLVEGFPPTWTTWPSAAKTARHVYIRAQFSHMGLVTNAYVLPALVRLLPVALLADLPWQQPLGVLAPLPPPPGKKRK